MKIIGLLTTTDSGKSLLQDYFRKNFKNQIFESTNHGPGQITDSIKKLSSDNLKDKDIVIDLISKHGCDTLMFPFVQDMFNNESIKQMYKNYITKKNKIFVFVRPYDFNYYCDKGIYVARDIRARWTVSQHRALGVKGYGDILKNYFNDYDNIKDKSNILEVVFENFIEDPIKGLKEIQDYCGLINERDFVPSTKRYNKWLTEKDLKNIRIYVEDGNLLKQSDLDYLSEDFYDYNKRYSYPERLLIKDIYPKTLIEDINRYLT